MKKMVKKKIDLDHPCKGACTGWNDGYDRGHDTINFKGHAEINRLKCRLEQTSSNMGKMLLRADNENSALTKRRDVLVSAIEAVLVDIKKSGNKELYERCLQRVQEFMNKPLKRGVGRKEILGNV